ncbi:MAG TPA: proton-conducting transporter membrane subunit [Actinomycetes bacterium]|nr:proton-conducting transporter membrane subunit [Actinomycetes bacterium]
MDALPVLPVVVPLLVAAVLVGLGTVCPRRAADTATLATAAIVTVCCLALLVDSLDGPVVYWFGGWTPRQGIALGVAFAVDPVGAAVASLAGVLATAALTFSWRIFEAVRTLHHGLMLVFLAGIVGFCLSGDLFNMFVFYELFSVAAYALAGYRTTDPGSVRGALNFAITNSVGAILVLAGIALLYGRTGALNLAQLGQSLAGRPADRLVVVAFLLLMVGFFVKAAVVPFHFWLADAYALAPTVVGVLLAGVVSELGLYAVVRVYWTVFSEPLAGIEGLRGVMLLGAVTTALVGGVMCLLQHHLSRMLAYATVSHVGLTLAGFALLGPAGTGGAVLYLVADGMIKGSLFISVGILDHHLGDVDELRLQGRGRHLGWLAGLMVAGALGLAGVPPFGTFLGKALMEEAAAETGVPWLIGLFVVVAALTSAALLRATGRVFLGLGPCESSAGQPGAPDEAAVRHPHVHATQVAPAVLLLAGALALGLAPQLATEAKDAADHFTDRPAYAAAVLQGAAEAPSAESHQPVHLVAPALWAALSALLGLGLALVALRPERLPARLRDGVTRAWSPVADVLRGLHGGTIGDSVTWLVVGLAGFGTLLAVVVR